MKKILVIGQGGREVSICKKLYLDNKDNIIYIAPGNYGAKKYAKIIDIKMDDLESLLKFSKDNKIDLVIVGNELPLSLGIVDLFKKNNILIFGPCINASKIEFSKDYAKKIMQKYNIKTSKYKTVTNISDAYNEVKKFKFPIVLKYDGLLSGKGVIIVYNNTELKEAFNYYFNELNTKKLVIEEYLVGIEFSYLCLVNENVIIPLMPLQDYKRAYDNNKGENTGGMGCHNNLDFLNNNDLEESYNIIKNMRDALKKEGIVYKGVMYGGFIKTSSGIKVIEFNSRFGDPECEILMSLLKTDLYELLYNVLINKEVKVEFNNLFTVGVVLASKGYPKSKSNEIIIDTKNYDDKIIDMSSTFINNKKYYKSGRCLIVIESSNISINDAIKKVYNIIDDIKNDDVFYRKDIGIIYDNKIL